ncbi:hypothetical protein [Ureibacillus galli]|uniref:hypothetical protein n=1 Tax=Ureibacillus galli TaxID=2762222 RepID=UPI001783B106|nr:hypothetical protein [Ureibacillus galli]
MKGRISHSKIFSLIVIVILLVNNLSSIFIPVATAATLTGSVADNLYFTEKDQNEKIQELTVEGQEFSIDLVLQAGQDVEAEMVLPEGLTLSENTLTQEGFTYEDATRSLKVDWTKFTENDQIKRVALSFTNTLVDEVSIQAKTVREGQIYYSQPLNIISTSSDSTPTTQETNSEEAVNEEDSSKVSTNEATSSTTQETTSGETLKEEDSSKTSSGISTFAAAAAFTINNTDSYAGVVNNVAPKFIMYQLDGTSTVVKASINLN